MAKTLSKKRKSKKDTNVVISFDKERQNLIKHPLGYYCMLIYLPYAKGVNLLRSVPDAKDGLKVVERRIIWTVKELKATKQSQCKVSQIVGDCLGKYHPHGDISVYKSIVNMGQWWKNTEKYVATTGSWGTIDGEKAAAMRYIEAGLSPFINDVYFKYTDDALLDYKPNYSGKLLEPLALAPAIPIALINGTMGIGVGLSSVIPPNNLTEVIDLTKAIMKNPNKKDCYLIPDFTTGCDIVDNNFRNIWETGEGTIYIQANYSIDPETNAISIHSIPPNCKINKLISQLVALTKSGDIDLIDIVDNSKTREDKQIIDIKLYPKKGASPMIIVDKIFKATKLRDTLAMRFELTYEFDNVRYNLRSYILDWLELRRDIIRRQLIKDIKDMYARYHFLEVLVDILGSPKKDKELADICRKAKNRADIEEKIIKAFNINDLQARAISGFRAYERSQEYLQKYREEFVVLKKSIKATEYDLEHEERINEIIISQLDDIKNKYGRPRRSKVIQDPFVKGSYVADTVHSIVVTNNKIKKVDDNNLILGNIEGDETVIFADKVSNLDKLLVFTQSGICYGLNVSELLSVGYNSTGIDISGYCGVAEGDNIVGCINYSNYDKSTKMILATHDGIIKRMNLNQFDNAQAGGLIALSLNKDDKLTYVEALDKKVKEIMIYSVDGYGDRITVTDIPITQRNSIGVKAIKGKHPDLKVMQIHNDKRLFVLRTDKNNMKVCDVDALDTNQRARKNPTKLITLKTSDKKGRLESLVQLVNVSEKDTITLFNENDKVLIPIKDATVSTKIAVGNKKLFKGQIEFIK